MKNRLTFKLTFLMSFLFVFMASAAINTIRPEPATWGSRKIAVSLLKKGIMKKNTQITVYFKSKSVPNKAMIQSVYKDAVAHTGIPGEGDYLRQGVQRHKGVGNFTADPNGGYLVRIDYTFEYLDPRKDEDELLPLPVVGDTDDVDEEIVEIADVVSNMIEYDNGYDGGPNATAMGAMKSGKGVCNAYVMLFYNIALASGLDCRIVTGYVDTPEGQVLHAWNMVIEDGKAIKVDPTWYDESGRNRKLLFPRV